MDKKMTAIIAIYTIIMAGLLIITFAAGWNPSNYNYSLNENELMIEQGLLSSETETVRLEGQYQEAVLFMAKVSQEREQWKMDLIVTGILLPFLLLAAVPDRRPFQKYLPKKWYITLVGGAALLYLVYSVSMHVIHLNEIQVYVDRLNP